MASYDRPIYTTRTITIAGQTTATYSMSPPPGCTQCSVADMQASITGTAFAGNLTPGILSVGVAGNIAVAGSMTFGTAATPSPANSTVGYGAQRSAIGVNPVSTTLDLTGTSNTIVAGTRTPEVLGPVLITYTASTGGSPAGSAIADITLAWF